MEIPSLLVVLAAVALSAVTWVDAATDVAAECTAPLETMITCLSYVQGSAPAPGETCCTNLEKVHETHPKCLCALIAQSGSNSSTAAASGIPPIDPKLALKLPVACKVAANPKVCPGLLGISPSSPEASIFETTSSGSNSTSTGVTPAAEAPPAAAKVTTSEQGSNSVILIPRVYFIALPLFIFYLF